MTENNSLEKNAFNFWALIQELYDRRDLILEASKRLTEHVRILKSIDNRLSDCVDKEDDTGISIEKAKQIIYEESDILQIFSDVQAEVNTIISYANQLSPHSDELIINKIDLMSRALLIYMDLPGNQLVSHLGFLISDIELFAQEVNRIRINPTKKSINTAFGIDIGNEWAKIKEYIEKNISDD
jgi:hypothetical protein